MKGALDQIMETRPPRGALAIVAVGLLATVAAALLTSTKLSGAVALEWEKTVPIPNSRDVSIPGGGAMRIANPQISTSEETSPATNCSGSQRSSESTPAAPSARPG